MTHEEALAVSDRVIVMEGGASRRRGTPEELYEAPKSRASSPTSSAMRNLLDGELRVDAVGATFEAGGVRLRARRRRAGRPGGARRAAAPPARRAERAGADRGRCRRVAYLGSRAGTSSPQPALGRPAGVRRQRADPCRARSARRHPFRARRGDRAAAMKLPRATGILKS